MSEIIKDFFIEDMAGHVPTVLWIFYRRHGTSCPYGILGILKKTWHAMSLRFFGYFKEDMACHVPTVLWIFYRRHGTPCPYGYLDIL